MKRQSTLSSFFTKREPKRPKLTPPPPPTQPRPSLQPQDIQALHVKFAAKLGAQEQAHQEKRQRAEHLQANAIPLQKFTKLEEQVVEFKAMYPGCLLLIEVGYKFRFFGEDAQIASRILNIAHFIDRNFYVASIPVHRLEVHVHR